jgi:hypothetical protein
MSLFDDRYAVYLPAVTPGYLNSVSKRLPQGRRFPDGLSPSDLMFWEPNNLWHYPYLLHSIGQYRVGARPGAALDKANRRHSVLIGDSGGYQIGKGTLSGLRHIQRRPMEANEAVTAWRKERAARKWIKDWLAEQCDYGMTIDMPLWATSASGTRSPFHHCSSKQLIQMTNQNLRLLDRFSPPTTRWLNVVQGGSNYLDAIEWFRATKWFKRGGWALAGSAGVAGGLVNLLITVMMMRDEDAFRPGQDWLHVLGVSTPLWAVILTAVQRELRRVNPALKVSFDSSSPFLLGGRFERVCVSPELSAHPGSWSLQTEPAPQRPSYASDGCTRRFPFKHSPLGQRLKLNELNVREGKWQPRQYDSLSNAMLINHNVWTYLDTFRRANELFEQQRWDRVPREFVECVEVIGEVFACEDVIQATHVLEGHIKLLERLSPMTM